MSDPVARLNACSYPDDITPRITARDAAAVQRLWTERVLSDVDVDRALIELAGLVAERDEAGRIVERLRAAWQRDALRRAEAFISAR
jgi:hypothetical protein